jgi:hypothetical protein
MPEKIPEQGELEGKRFEKQKQVKLVEEFVVAELGKEVSAERRTELTRGLVVVADFMASAGIDMYVAGGGAVDLFDGKWDRDHQDLDVAIFGENRRKFFEAAMQAGYVIDAPGGNPKRLGLVDIEDPRTHNAFLSRDYAGGTSKFEVMFLNTTAAGEVELEKGVTVPGHYYTDAPKVQIEGREVAITPPEVNLYFKLLDGRRKDFRDIAGMIEVLSPEQRANLEASVAASKVSFKVGEVDTTDIGVLLEAAKTADAAKHTAFFENEIEGIETRLNADLMARCDELLEIKSIAPDHGSFIDTVAERYPGSDRRVVIEAAADFLYQSPTPAPEAFRSWAKTYTRADERLGPEALRVYSSEKLWEVK